MVRLVRRSLEVPDAIDEECRELAERLGCRPAVRVRLTSEVSTPCLAGLWRPVLLLPERECKDLRADDLRAILAHELAHARNHDLTWNLAAHLASIVLWFHPLAWRIRAAHATACDAVCDAVAVDVFGDVVSYGRVLARLALKAARQSPVHGLAMARSSDVRRRIEALNRMVFATRLSWRRVMPAVVVGSVLLLVIGGFGFTRESAPAPHDDRATAASTSQGDDLGKPVDPTSPGKLTIRTVAAETRRTDRRCVHRIPRAALTARTRKGPSRPARTVWRRSSTQRAHADYFEIHRPQAENSYNSDALERQAPARGTSRCSRSYDSSRARQLAGSSTTRPVIRLQAPRSTSMGRRPSSIRVGPSRSRELKTDARGRWRLDVAPAKLAGVRVTISHPRYEMNGAPVSRNLDSVIVLAQGPSVTGRVIDAAGRPVKGARASFGHDTVWSPIPQRRRRTSGASSRLRTVHAAPRSSRFRPTGSPLRSARSGSRSIPDPSRFD